MAAYGFFNGPTVAYCYDLVNRLTIPSERGMSIVMFGLNFGASLVPYIVSDVWNAGGGPSTLSVSIFLSMLVPLPLLYLTKVRPLPFQNLRKALRSSLLHPSSPWEMSRAWLNNVHCGLPLCK
jgi:hypothetical protein